ncbi:MAG TPA: CDP-alcohol phosphatidyltransferase family protein [Vicinamibacterales bacterium]|jgi:phosphatidylcholine synthase
MTRARVLAWCVHAYTALGLVCAAGIAVLIVGGGDAALRAAFLVMMLATAIDATDGWLARRFRVKEVLPGFDGRRLDDLIDFQTYTCLPLLLLWRAGVLGAASPLWMLVPLVASAYGFCQVEAKTDDNYFLGFPSYWNIVALYLYLIRPPEAWVVVVLVGLAILTFAPARYLYPSHAGPLSTVTNVLALIWAVALVVIVWRGQAAPSWLVLVSLAFPAYYMLASWTVSVRHWRGRLSP